jgi:hypothetical protein
MATMAAVSSSRVGPLLRSANGSAAKLSSATNAVVRDGCVAANSVAVANAPPIASRTASLLPRSFNTAVVLSAHCSKVGSAPGVTGSDAPVPGWSKKISRPIDVIASTNP